MPLLLKTLRSRCLSVLSLLAATLLASLPAGAAEPIRIGFTMSLTGGFSSSGKPALVAMKIWEEDINARGGLLGRPVKLVYYDDQSTPANAPALYTKLLDVDKVDLIVGPYGTNMTAPMMPVAIQRNMVVISLVALNVNERFRYDKYFAMVALGSTPTTDWSKGLFDVLSRQNPRPKTIAIAAADSEFSKNNADGARANAKALGMEVVYDRAYPPNTTDFSSIVRAVQATNPDAFYVASYPPDSVGMVRAVRETGFKPKFFGGAMVGLQVASLKTQLGPLLNGVVSFENWLPVPSMAFPGMGELLRKYQARATTEGVEALGYFLTPPAYAYLQVLAEAVTGTRGLDQDRIAEYIRSHTFDTVWGKIRFGKDGSWPEPRLLTVQFRGITGNGIEQFTDPAREVVLDPPAFRSGDMIYPYGDALR
jgi:branched-chain amino acid transport system substrate-binding protein